MTIRLTGLNSHPLKSGRALSHQQTLLTATGLAHDREWMLVDANARFMTQREWPALARVQATVHAEELRLEAPGLAPLRARASGAPREVRIWKDCCDGLDAGDDVAAALSRWLGTDCRLVRFDARRPRPSEARWTAGHATSTAFSDAFPLLFLNRASLADLNRRLPRPLPANRFRANLEFEGLEAWAEDRLDTLRSGDVVLKAVKPCTRCVVTTTDQESGQRDGDQPLRALRSFRHDAALHGVTFCENLIIVAGVGATLAVGSEWQASWRE